MYQSDQCRVFEMPILVHTRSQTELVCIKYMCNCTHSEATSRSKTVHFLNLTDRGFILHPTMLADLKGFYRTIAQFMAQFEKIMGQTVIKLFFLKH